jgi:hypothetical protein
MGASRTKKNFPPQISSKKKSEAGRILRVCIYRQLIRRHQS